MSKSGMHKIYLYPVIRFFYIPDHKTCVFKGYELQTKTVV
jgi:hypothetical protein